MIRFLLPVLAALALFATSDAQAQGAGDSAASSFLEEIIVTARKREENVLQISESVSVLSSTTIERANIVGLADVGLLVPNLNMSRRADGFPNVSIRGLGGFGNTQGVGFYLDDVQLFSDASARFGDLERIEVLKGPQGVLFGGANIGGAVKYVTKRPDPSGFAGNVRLRAGEDSYFEGEGTLNMPLSDDWALRLFGIFVSDDSFLENTNAARQNGGTGTNSADIGQLDETSLRLTLGGDFTDTFSMFAAVRYNDFDGPNNIWSIEPDGNLEYPTDINFSVNGRHEKETVAVSLELNWELGAGDITYLGSTTSTDSDRLTDLDTTNEFVIDFFRPHELDVLTQELRYSSDDDGPLQWQAGVYYLLYERDIRTDLLALGGFGFFDPTTGLPVPPPNDGTEPDLVVAVPWEYSARERTQTAGFGNFSYRSGNIEFSAGVRFDNWESERCVDWTAGVENSPAFCGSQDDTETLGRASVAWFTNDDRGMFYGTFSQGFEPGDFNLNNRAGETTPLEYGPEHSDQFEIGYKGRHADDRVIFQIAAFYIDYEARQFELQENDPVTGGFTEGIINAGDSEHIGIEADILAELNDNWTLSAGVGFVDVEWKSGTVSPVNGTDISGMTPPNTSDFSYALALDYDREMGANSSIFGRLQVTGRDDSTTNAQWFDAPGDDFPFWDNPGFTVVDLNLGYKTGNWTIDLLMQNLTDEEYYIDAQEFPNFAGSARPGPPGLIVIGTLEQSRRTILSVRYAF
ncbi:MAG: TonB-dependent receptor plug domain-containing protein [Gammaproteobacteria bacterium]